MYASKDYLSTLVGCRFIVGLINYYTRPPLCRSQSGLALRRPSGLATAARRQLNNLGLLTSINSI